MDHNNQAFRVDSYLSAHGRARARQRGMSNCMIEALDTMADQEVSIGKGCVALGVSQMAADEARAEGVSPDLLSRLRRRAMIVASDGTIVTLFVKQRASGRHYSRRSRATARERLRARRR